MEFTELYKGIDSLYVSFKGTLKEDIKAQLEEKKSLAQASDEKKRARAKLIIEDHCFEVKDKGKGLYAYVLVDAWYHIQVSPSQRKTLPPVYVQLSSYLITHLGIHEAMSYLRTVVERLLVNLEVETVSRADLFVDFITDMDFEAIKKTSWIRRAKKYKNHWTGDIFTGWSMGFGGVISGRLYDKTEEIKESGKYYLKTIWQEKGWSEGQRVWRLEFQLERQFLKQMSVNGLSDFIDVSNDIWRYCTDDWLRLVIEGDTENRNRWETHPLWNRLQLVKFQPGDYTGITRTISKSRMPDDRRLFLNGLGYITAYAAIKGFDDIDELTMIGFLLDMRKFLESYVKHLDRYNDSADYLKTMINLKKRKYNKV